MARSPHLTYELYLKDQEGRVAFEALTCPPDADVLAIVQRLLAERKLRSVEVRRLGEHVYTVGS